VVRLSIPAQHVYRDLAVSSVLTAIDAEGEGPDADVRDEIISALVEAYSNVVLHAYRGIEGGRIDLSVLVGKGVVEIQLCDQGRSFDPASVRGYAAPDSVNAADIDIASLPESGMGLFIIRSFMDEVTYTKGGGGRPNVVVLRKRWPAGASSASMQKNDPSRSGWRMRSVAVHSGLDDGASGRLTALSAPSPKLDDGASAQWTGGSLKRK
jgi:serine/threonine-protein kinase RsbW